MKHVLVAGAASLVLAGSSCAAGLALRSNPEPSRAAARAALLAWDAPNGRPDALPKLPPDARGRYWWTLASFERALAAGAATQAARVQQLTAAEAELSRQAARGTAADRSRALSLLALTRVARTIVEPNSASQQRSRRGNGAVDALRAAVTLDPTNDDAKANLEQLLRSTPPKRQRGKPNTPQNGQKGGPPPQQAQVAAPAGGAGKGVKVTPVGY